MTAIVFSFSFTDLSPGKFVYLKNPRKAQERHIKPTCFYRVLVCTKTSRGSYLISFLILALICRLQICAIQMLLFG